MYKGEGVGLLQFSLKSGRVVRVDNLCISRTYASLLEGTPDDEYNERLIQRARSVMVPVWGERATYVVSPLLRRVTEVGRTYNRLPELRYHAWLLSDAMDTQRCDSELVAIWYGPREPDVSMRGIVTRALENLPWEQFAQDFDY